MTYGPRLAPGARGIALLLCTRNPDRSGRRCAAPLIFRLYLRRSSDLSSSNWTPGFRYHRTLATKSSLLPNSGCSALLWPVVHRVN